MVSLNPSRAPFLKSGSDDVAERKFYKVAILRCGHICVIRFNLHRWKKGPLPSVAMYELQLTEVTFYAANPRDQLEPVADLHKEILRPYVQYLIA